MCLLLSILLLVEPVAPAVSVQLSDLPDESFTLLTAPWMLGSRAAITVPGVIYGQHSTPTLCECSQLCLVDANCVSLSFDTVSLQCSLSSIRGGPGSTEFNVDVQHRIRPKLAVLGDWCRDDADCALLTSGVASCVVGICTCPPAQAPAPGSFTTCIEAPATSAATTDTVMTSSSPGVTGSTETSTAVQTPPASTTETAASSVVTTSPTDAPPIPETTAEDVTTAAESTSASTEISTVTETVTTEISTTKTATPITDETTTDSIEPTTTTETTMPTMTESTSETTTPTTTETTTTESTTSTTIEATTTPTTTEPITTTTLTTEPTTTTKPTTTEPTTTVTTTAAAAAGTNLPYKADNFKLSTSNADPGSSYTWSCGGHGVATGTETSGNAAHMEYLSCSQMSGLVDFTLDHGTTSLVNVVAGEQCGVNMVITAINDDSSSAASVDTAVCSRVGPGFQVDCSGQATITVGKNMQTCALNSALVRMYRPDDWVEFDCCLITVA